MRQINPRFFDDEPNKVNGVAKVNEAPKVESGENEEVKVEENKPNKFNIISGNVYYKKSSDKLWNKDHKAVVTLDANKNGTATIYNLESKTKYDIVAVYSYEENDNKTSVVADGTVQPSSTFFYIKS